LNKDLNLEGHPLKGCQVNDGSNGTRQTGNASVLHLKAVFYCLPNVASKLVLITSLNISAVLTLQTRKFLANVSQI